MDKDRKKDENRVCRQAEMLEMYLGGPVRTEIQMSGVRRIPGCGI